MNTSSSMPAMVQNRKQLEAALNLKSWEDGNLRSLLGGNPQTSLESLGLQLSGELAIVTTPEASRTLRIVVPHKPAETADGELSDSQLENVSGGIAPLVVGGIIVGAAALVALIGGGATGVGIWYANDVKHQAEKEKAK